MTIVDVTTFPLRIRHSDVYLGAMPDGSEFPRSDRYTVREPWRSLYSPFFETLLIRISDSDGMVGWGEALTPVAPTVAARVVDTMLTPFLTGQDPTHVRPLMSRLRALMRERGHQGGHQADALAAVDIALWDLAGKKAGRPVYELLGGAYRAAIPTYVSGLPRADDAGRAELAAQWSDQGVRAFKLHVGFGVDKDLAAHDAVAAVHPDIRVAIDAHWAYRLSEATVLGRELDARRALFYEAPLVPEDLTGHAQLAEQLSTPVAIGETLRHRYDFASWIGTRALDVVQPDVGRTGITELMSIAEIAAAHHLPTAPHHSTCVGPALLAGLQVSTAVEDLLFFEYQPTTVELSAVALTEPQKHTHHGFAPPDGPGLGSDIDIDALLSRAVDSDLIRDTLEAR